MANANIEAFINTYGSRMLPQQVILLRAAADYFDSFPVSTRSDLYKPTNTLATITVISGGSGASRKTGPGQIELTLPPLGGNGSSRIPVAGIPGWDNSTFLIYDTDMAVVHEIDHAILSLLSGSGLYSFVRELDVAILAHVGGLAISRATDPNSGQVDLNKVAVEMRILYGFHVDEFGYPIDENNNPADSAAALSTQQKLDKASLDNSSHENIFNTNRNFYSIASIDSANIPAAYRVGYVSHFGQGAPDEDGQWKTEGAGEADFNTPGTRENLILKGVGIAWLGNQYDNTMIIGADPVLDGGGQDYLDGGNGNDTLDGGSGSDTLLGGADDDTIQGGLGEDYLEGGVGLDTYVYNFGDGTDTLLDTDGLGNIVYRDAQGIEYILAGGTRTSTSGSSTYYDSQGRFAYDLDTYSDILSVTLDGQIAFTIQDYDLAADTLGIKLTTYCAPEIDTGRSIRLVSTGLDCSAAVGGSGSYAPHISADGRYVTFTSGAFNLVPGDTNREPDIFVKDILTGTITRVSTAADGTEANGESYGSTLSADGRYLAFESVASNLVPEDTNAGFDIFVKDLQTGMIVRADTDANGTETSKGGALAYISADARYVAFYSNSSDLVPGDTNGYYDFDIFIKDLQTGSIVRANTAADGTEANGTSEYGFSLTADNRYIAFTTSASNLVPGDTADTGDIFLKDLQTGAITRAMTYAELPSLSGDGRYMAFVGYGPDLVSGWPYESGIFVKDLQTGAIVRADTAADGTVANDYGYAPYLSADGRYLVFLSYASNLVTGDTNGEYDVFVKDIQTGAIARVSTSADGTEANGSSGSDHVSPSISADGRYVVFESGASNLVPGDTNDSQDVFIAPNPLYPGVEEVIADANTPTVIDDISISDHDAGSELLALALSVAHGSIALQQIAGLTFTDADGSDGTLAFSGLLSDLNSALAPGIVYTPFTGYSGDDSLNLLVTDQTPGGGLSDSANIDIIVLPPAGPTPGPDNLTGTAGADTLTGGQGNDILSGGAGDDTYVFNLGDGVDTIDDLTLAGEGNALQFGTGIDPATLTLSYEGGYLVLNLGGGDQLRLSNFSNTDVYGAHAVETFSFADGTVLSYSQLIDRGFDLVGTAGDDIVVGTNGVDRILGGGGNDVINGGGGNDILMGGAGDDTYRFDAGNGTDTIYDSAAETNTLVFGPGVDPASVTLNLGSLFLNLGNGEGIHLEGFDPNDAYNTSIIRHFTFDDGTTLDLNQLLALGFDIGGTDGDDTLTGTNVTDRMTGGAGNDALAGGAGDDTYFYSLGDGLDTLTDSEGTDTVSFGAGYRFDNTVIRIDGNIARLRFLDADGCEGTEGMDIALNPDGSSPIEAFGFGDGTSYSLDDLLVATEILYGTKKADTLIGGRNDDTIYAGKGGDIVYGRTGNDSLYGEKGNDSLYGEGGHDTLYGDKGNDRLEGGAGNDLLDGGKGHNTIIGGQGNDTLILGKGEDTIQFGLDDGWDTLKTADKDPEDNDLVFGPGIARDSLWFSRHGNDLQINVLGTDDGLTVEGWYNSKHKPLEEIQTSDGAELEAKQVELLVQAMAAFNPIPGPDSPLPTQMPDELQATLAVAWES